MSREHEALKLLAPDFWKRNPLLAVSAKLEASSVGIN
jgi:hypothetical protein